MVLAYVIGPYRAATPFEITKNIEKAKKMACWLWMYNIACICPHMNTALLDGLVPDATFLKGDIEMLKRCDIAVTVDGWEESAGSQAEVSFCKEQNIPVFHSVHMAVFYKQKKIA